MGNESHYTSSNLGGIKRGDSAETGDLEAAPTELEQGKPASQMGMRRLPTSAVPNEIDDLTVKDAADPSLGMTNVAGRPPDDPIADTGDAATDEAEAQLRRP